MYFDRKLWAFTRGVRGRIWLSVLIGVASSGLGVARLAMLGWLLGMVFGAAPISELLWAAVFVAAVIIARGVLEYGRTMIAHGTAAIVNVTYGPSCLTRLSLWARPILAMPVPVM